MPGTRFASRRSIASELRRLHAAGRSMQPRALRRRHPRLWAALGRHFGSYEQALAFARIDRRASSKPVVTRWDRGRIVEALRAREAMGGISAPGRFSKPILLLPARSSATSGPTTPP